MAGSNCCRTVRFGDGLDLLPFLPDGDACRSGRSAMSLAIRSIGRLERLRVLGVRGRPRPSAMRASKTCCSQRLGLRRLGGLVRSRRNTRSSSSGRRSGTASCAGRGRTGLRQSRVPRPIICQNLT